MDSITISRSKKAVKSNVHLKGSKSISNRALIIRALCKRNMELQNLSDSKDTKTLEKMLTQTEGEFNAGHAGTSFRFMTAYLAFKDGEQILTGSERMQQRPIGPLVQALNSLGANIAYINKEGYPPLRIGSPNKETGGEVDIQGDISSQFLSALLLVAPYCDKGIRLNINGDLVSRPYLQMTIDLVKRFGVNITEVDKSIIVEPGNYTPQDFFVEGDWSSASYLYEICALAENAEINISGLQKDSLQGDSRIAEFARSFGVESTFSEQSVNIKKDSTFKIPEVLEFDLIEQPDLCQTLVCICAGLGISSIFTGLQTLKIKETDRIEALKNELQKMNVYFSLLPSKFSEKSSAEYYMLNGKVEPESSSVQIETYEDHRMAMSFAPLSMIRQLEILNKGVVVKSYPDYWEDLKKFHFIIS